MSFFVTASERATSPLHQFLSPTSFSNYCRNLWGAPITPTGPRYMVPIPEYSEKDKSNASLRGC
ncbi:unnamed protein product [Acanthoscelides obtectus]|uniref:Uncharacterized protein n=1 Tax=Acanthoscelides obtectus TaxID=200917 RepID=A0A9P0MIK7_ACAOB|nr:unnamed protein product [Acanthoscelides obtectus]CAK1645087.1 hypothetical protein AOBTE_LOCUS14018 [Acanthoscelides obtectus]